MDADVKRQLDLRLAKGEISKEEYLSTMHTLTQNAGGGNVSVSSLFSTVKAALFEKYQMVVPTAESPLIVNSEFLLYGSYLTYKERQLCYAEIISLGYEATQTRSTGGLQKYDATLYMLPIAGKSISVSGSLSFSQRLVTDWIGEVGAKPIKPLQNAYLFLRHITFQQRLQWRLSEFETQGYIDMRCPGQVVKLYPNGYIEKDVLRINLKEAYQNNLIRFGTSDFFLTNPTMMVFRESTKMFSRKIEVGLWIDYDVFKFVILGLAEGNTI